MKEIVKTVTAFTLKSLILLVLLLIFASISYFTLVRPAVRNLVQQQTLAVDGTAKKYIKPDLAIVRVGVVLNKTTAAELKKEADTNLSGTRKELLEMGIAEEKIRSNYTISPKYDRDYQYISGYTTRVSMEVKTKDFTQVDAILESAQNNGLILVNSVSFEIEDPIAAKEQLREEAIAAAKTKAEKLSKETGISLGKVVNISEGGYSPYYNNLYRTNTFLDSSYEMMPIAEEESGSTMDAGETEIQMTVTLYYETN